MAQFVPSFYLADAEVSAGKPNALRYVEAGFCGLHVQHSNEPTTAIESDDADVQTAIAGHYDAGGVTRIPAPGNPRYLVNEAFYDAENNIFWDGQQAWIYIEPAPNRAAESWSATTALEPAQLHPEVIRSAYLMEA
ncbi:hypothetical protein WR25_03331 [Diploscapter pachys]|uniref:Uncharacterized protein n=1 Tax=Diploscapter pachys TaxID=2018661 RepID=A0A2A2L3U7_9BILA|nr:hypothetical protein WR25_03331 [Diploscapter pachys]